MEKDQIKAIIKDLRSKGLSFQKISDILRELHSVDLNRETVRVYFKEGTRIAPDKAQGNNGANTNKAESTDKTTIITTQEQTKVQLHDEKMQALNNANMQTIHKTRYPGFEDEDLRKDPYYNSISINYLEMTPKQRYQQHLKRVEQDRKERNKSIALIALIVFMLIGLVFALKYRLV